MLNQNSVVSPPSPKTEQVAALAKALAHPARVRIITFLLSRPGCIGGDIVDQVGLAQSTVSEHLRVLKEAGIVKGRIDYPRVCYSLDPAALAPLQALLESIAAKPPESEDSFCYTPEGYVPRDTAQ